MLSNTELRDPEKGAFHNRCSNVLTCSAGGGHSNFFDFDGDEILAHLSSPIFFRSKKQNKQAKKKQKKTNVIFYFKDPHSRIIEVAFIVHSTCT